MTRIVSDMDEHSKVKADAKVIVKEAYDAVGSKDDQIIAGFIKVRHISHESKHFIFITMGKSNVLLYKCG